MLYFTLATTFGILYSSVMSTALPAKQRLLSIDILKAAAVILVLNHRIYFSYGDFQFLVFGGALGCGIFFFLSGYTIGAGHVTSFKSWVQRRLGRLIPSVLVIGFIANYGSWVVFCTSFLWFVHCIVIYYLLFYFIKRYIPTYMLHLECGLGLLYAAGFIIDWHSLPSLYGSTVTKWFLYFLFFLAGAIVRQHPFSVTQRKYVFFGIMGPLLLGAEMMLKVMRNMNIISDYCLLLSPCLMLLGIMTLFAALSGLDARAEQSSIARFFHPMIAFVAALSLEAYIGIGPVCSFLQHLLLPLFPLNIPLVMLGLLGFCYLLRVCIRFVLALLSAQEEKLSWRYIFASFL